MVGRIHVLVLPVLADVGWMWLCGVFAGAGKTSLLRMLSCEVEPSRGFARIAGHDTVRDKRAAQLHMGLCPQFDYLVDVMTPEEHLYYYARVKGIPEHMLDRTVEAFIQLTSLTPHRHKWSCELSGGNKRKLSLAIALIGNPEVLFLDEPSTGMDPGARRFVWSLIARLKANRSIILTTHSMVGGRHVLFVHTFFLDL
jgi:ATP-binding cassette subfamily A (ABC1) protein 3